MEKCFVFMRGIYREGTDIGGPIRKEVCGTNGRGLERGISRWHLDRGGLLHSRSWTDEAAKCRRPTIDAIQDCRIAAS